MNKPLTIEQLKALPISEWVWVIDKCIYGNGIYCTIDCQDDDEPICILSSRINTQVYKFDDYGKTWTAYKNKEQAECADDIERKAQKAMAKKIFQEMYDIVNESRDEVITLTADDVKRIAKRYGVEVRK